jgi:hypothetical protein
MRGLLIRLAEGNSASVPNNAVSIKWLYEQLKAAAAVGMRARPSNAAAESAASSDMESESDRSSEKDEGDDRR